MRLFCLALLLAAAPAVAQQADSLPPNPYPRTPPQVRVEAAARRAALQQTSLVANVPLRNIGPTVMSGRVVDVDVSPTDPTHFYVAYASGGLWVTRNNGQSFTPLFDREAVMTIGDIAVDWQHGERLWVGTGESNSSRSSYAGAGLYTSADSGRTWTPRGLADGQHVGRVVLHPTNPDVLWAAVVGPLYSPGGERGVYRSADGGQTWTPTLQVNDNTGAIDLVVDEANPDVLYAATWERARRAWNFVEAGAGSGVWKSTDGGQTWARLNTDGSGLPTGADVGRIGLALHAASGTLYALVDNQARAPEKPDAEADTLLTREKLRTMTRDAFVALAEEKVEAFLAENGFPASYTAQTIIERVREGTITPLTLVEYLEDANARLFDTPVIGAELYRSVDGGATWTRQHAEPLDNVFFSYGYYFGTVRVSPFDPQKVYVLGLPILRSDDGGATWKNINGDNVHVDHHALWTSAARPGHLINGNDGGLNISYDDGETWFKANTPPVGQFYAIAVDDAEPYRVYGGLQDNGVWRGPSDYEASNSWYEEGEYPYNRLGGGDGMQVEVDTRDNETVYYGFQFGFYSRRTGDGRPTTVRPQHELGERPYRYNWQTPIRLSRHNQDVLYMGSNFFHRSLDRGQTFEKLSGDLTNGGRPGDVPYGTISTLDESPLRFGLLYAGTDDGLVHVSRDGGYSWTRITSGLPPDLWVSRVAASHHAEGRVYASLNGYRWDYMDAHVYRSDDYGATWTRIGTDLPAEPVNVILEDPHNPDLLYVGTDNGLYVSLDRGGAFMAMMHDFPHVAVHDLVVQARRRELVVGTHGRSLFVADVSLVEQLTPALMAEAVHVFDTPPVTANASWGKRFSLWSEPVSPRVTVAFWAAKAGRATISVKNAEGVVVADTTFEAVRGLNYAPYDLRADAARVARLKGKESWKAAENGAFYLVPGPYTLVVETGGGTATTPLEVKPPRRPERRAEPRSEEEEEERLVKG